MFAAQTSLRAQPNTGAPATSGQGSTPEAKSPEAAQAVGSRAGSQSGGSEGGSANDKYRMSPMVTKIGGALGMKPAAAATAFEFLNFAVLAVLVALFLVKQLPGAFRDRHTAIQKNLLDARAATAEASARMAGIEDRLSHLDGQIAAMRAQAEKDSAADELRIKASVEEEKRKILASAEQEIAAATVHAQRQLQQYAAELAIEQAAKKLVISAETDRLLVKDFARRLGADDTKGGQN